MGKRYYCDFCDKSFSDNIQSRKRHFQGLSHQRQRRTHYERFKIQMMSDEQAKRTVRVPDVSGQDIVTAWLARNPQVVERARNHGISVELPEVIPFIPDPHESLPLSAPVMPFLSGSTPLPMAPSFPLQPSLPPSMIPSSMPPSSDLRQTAQGISPQGFPLGSFPLPSPHPPGLQSPGPYVQGIHPPGPHLSGSYPQGPHPSVVHPPGPHPSGPFPPGSHVTHSPGMHPPGMHLPGQRPPGQHPPDQHPPGPHPPGQHPPEPHSLSQPGLNQPIQNPQDPHVLYNVHH